MELEEAEDHQSLYYLEKKTEERTKHGKVIAWKKHSHILFHFSWIIKKKKKTNDPNKIPKIASNSKQDNSKEL